MSESHPDNPVPSPVSSAPGRPGAGHRRVLAVLAGFVLAYFALQLPSATRRSATFDEPLHLAAGYLALTEQDYRLDVTHPPLLRMWAALPLLGRGAPEPDTGPMAEWSAEKWISESYDLAHDFLFTGTEADAWLNRARGMNLVLGALLGLLVFAWIQEWLGFGPALAGLFLYLIEPNLAAHAALVTTDMGVTCFFFGAIYFIWRTGRQATPANLSGLALFTGLAAASKFSAILLGPAALLVLAVVVIRGAMTWRRAAGIVLLLFAASCLAIWAVYGFHYAPAAGGAWVGAAQRLAVLEEQLPVVGRMLVWVDANHLLPAAYTQGFIQSFTSAGNLPGYLAGEVSTTGWWYYFPFAFLVKTPVALLLLATGGALVLVRRRADWDALSLACVGLPPAVYLAAAMSTEINLGLRHILPVYPFVLLLAAVAVAAVLGADWRRRTQGLVLGPIFAGGLLVFTLSYPRHLTFFNVLVGGPGNGARYLTDSNLDWGQHLKLLKQWMNQHQVRRINLAYFGVVSPDYYGIENVPLPGSSDFAGNGGKPPLLPGYVAISATLLSGVYFSPEWRLFYRGFANVKPVAVIGNTINVYRVQRWPSALARRGAPAAEVEQHLVLARALVRLGWDRQAIVHFRRYLRRHPDNSRVLLRLGQALVRLGRPNEALTLFRRSVECAPQEGDSRGALARLLLDRQDIAGALRHARAYARLQPGNPYARDLLGVALASDSRLPEAVAEFTRAQELAPGEASIREHLRMAREMLAADPARF